MANSVRVPFAEPTGHGEVIVSATGRRLRLGIDKKGAGYARSMLVHAALQPVEVRQIRDALSAWLVAHGEERSES